MAQNILLRYDIYLPDKELVDTLNAEVEAGGGPTINAYAAERGLSSSVLVFGDLGPENAYFYFGPVDASLIADFVSLNAGFALGAVVPSDPVIDTIPCAMVSTWFDGNPENNITYEERTFESCEGGLFGICALWGNKKVFYWGARFIYKPFGDDDPETGTPVTAEPADIPARRWIDAFDVLQFGSAPTAVAGRWTRGKAPWTGTTALTLLRETAANKRTHNLTENTGGGASTVTQSWERLYGRWRSLPAADYVFWETNGFPTSADGVELHMLPTGQIACYNRNVSSTDLVGTTARAIVADELLQLDILLDIDAGTLRLLLSHELIGTFAVGSGWNAANVHTQSHIRTEPTNDNDNYVEWYFWTNADIPNVGGTETLTSIDFVRGSRPILIRGTEFAADHGDWTGAIGISWQNFDPAEVDVASESTTTTASDVYSVVTDAPSRILPIGGIGAVAMNICRYGHRGAGDGELGYNLDAAGDDYAAITEANGPSKDWRQRLVQLSSGNEALGELDSLELKYRKGADTTEGGLGSLIAIVEIVGQFVPEDVHPDAETEPPLVPALPVHNSPYYDTPWGGPVEDVGLLLGGVGLFSGTYEGTETEFDLAFPMPIQFLVIKRVDNSSARRPTIWMSSLLSAKDGFEQGNRPDLVKWIRKDPDYAGSTAEDENEWNFLARISADQDINTTGVTYHYFAVADPAARFILAESFLGLSSMNDKTLALQRADFTPLGAMIAGEEIGVTSTIRAWLKGGDLGADEVVQIDGAAELASALTFGAGQITVGNNSTMFSWGADNFGALLFRHEDGTEPDTRPVVVVGWTGDGSASRTIGVDLGGKRPLMAWAAGGATGDGYYRDPQATGTNSYDPNAGTIATVGITGGGIDSVSVGSDLNASGVPYVMIVFPGSETAGNGGWSIDGDFYPVAPDTTTDPGDPTESGGSSGGSSAPAEEPDLDNSTALPGTSSFCVDYTLKVCNMGLARIHHSNRIADLLTEQSREADLARENIKHEVETTLRDHSWSFATGYAALTLIAGSETSPANEDWTYHYAAPSDYVEGRRVIDPTKDKQREFDRDPEPWRMQSDETVGNSPAGRTLYANVEDAEFEYTRRVSCPAYFGDRHFIDALAWRMAKVFAGPLARDTRLQDYCEKKYQEALAIARSHDRREAMRHRSHRDHDASWIEEREGSPRTPRDREDW